MNVINIIIGTAILWGLTALLVLPLGKYMLLRKLAQPAWAHLRGTNLPASVQAEIETLATRYFMLADVLVLGLAGLFGGLNGYWFFGISTKAKGWPGMIAFVAASFLGLSLRSSHRMG